ncbi:MAG: acyl dehydratase [Rhodobacteraceae bacterium]|jgi:3-methylfumaryl-CoA hydratase|uniref:3-methylfumaryl-CoA hydratase n=1 Tax=Salipiger profundus TaxID=1229727 RepID=A0A1U7D2S0_9RHOB|nr:MULTISPECIES: acyl dehydratase [Salipiger]APX22441.1 3-methylfumaryl-CoA hydratase [Salipiger profundus]MAB06573.1 acyl dehydratase [Paracoccaceae bacterium]GGA26710.1 acyl-CoA dehydrogenase [Salipiger profundus]SFD86773.1 3-methylfumaryl-CoA hydratase [Salipiger profundus]
MTDRPLHDIRQTDVMDPARANALLIALGRPERLSEGDPLPPFFHQLHFWDAQPPEALGRDGHPRVGGLIPDLGLPRRMWAGGELRFHAPLRAGIAAEKRSVCENVTRKTGRSGPLGFVTLRHEVRQGGTLCVVDRQDLVYREDPAPDGRQPVPPRARTDEEKARHAAFDSTQLFRYSALTFNGHRIHYDADYCREVEGYPAPVVHGPLLAQLLMLMAEERAPLRGFTFRASAPVVLGETVTLCLKGSSAWIRGADGRQCMNAELVY